ncbi:Branched-chain amino acid ABC transporter amino acid-binding protein [Paramagnetospirillum magnetotacticum MS-1]|uniref:Branched-chain amino acid ABC transporter amino acid-binding protein n=2 Tax=Paramagnetospirillum magnetotacticum TaxID=188 RepID=A0A0C2YSD7_PARME|nr:Branched-chain amino acid ABC transporter amino acid-binding protein [Paramagnetospirillum magnetotacticum MS-1]
MVLLSGGAYAKTYKIGVLVPLTGPSAEKGIPLKNAAELFVEQFNAAPESEGNRLELVVRDDFDDPDKARAAAAEMVKDESLLAVVGHYYPGVALATGKIFADAKIPFLSPNVSSPAAFADNKWAFTLNMPDSVQGAFLAVYIKEVLKKDNILVIYNTDPFGSSLRDAFVAKAERLGLKVLKTLPVEVGPVAKDWAATNLPDATENQNFGIIATLTHSESGLSFLPQLRDAGIKAPVMAPNTWSNPKFLTELDEKYTANVYLASAFLWEIANQKASAFANAYTKRFGARPSVAAAMSFDAVNLIAKAIGAAEKGAPTRASIRDYVAGIEWHGFVEGVTGNLFYKNGRDMTAEYVGKYLQAKGETAPPPATGSAVVQASYRDVYVSVMKDGRFKTAPVQLLIPHEEYVLKEMGERIAKGQVTLVDGTPYHIVDVISVGVDVIRINDVSIKDMQWDVDVFMWFKWSGGRLDVKDIEKISAINAVKETSAIFKEDLTHGTKYRAYRKRLTLTAPYDLSNFPFDSQTLPLEIAHTNKNSTHVMLVPDTRHMETVPVKDIKPQEWTYTGRSVFSDLYRYDSTFGDPDYRMGTGYKSPVYFSTVNLEIGIKRILKPYLFTFFLPLLIILGIILIILWVPLDQFAPRINATISGLIGVLVYHMSQKNSFPKVGYTMSADYYFLVAYAFVVSMIFNIIFIQTLQSAGQKDVAKLWNKRLSIGAMIAAIVIYAAMTIFAMSVA